MAKISTTGLIRFFVTSSVIMNSLFSASLSATPESLQTAVNTLLDYGIYNLESAAGAIEFKNVKIIFVNPDCREMLLSIDNCNGQKNWRWGFRTIKEAVARVETLGANRLGVILVKKGTYTNFSEGIAEKPNGSNSPVLKLGGNHNMVIIGGFDGDVNDKGKLSSKENSVLDGRFSSFHVISAYFSESERPFYVEIRNFHIKRGCANFSNIITCDGASTALFKNREESYLNIDERNHPYDSGGGLLVNAPERSNLIFSLRETKFANNLASSRGGGLMFVVPSEHAQVHIVDSEFEENRAGSGGAFFAAYGSYWFEGNFFHINEGVFGGGAYCAVETKTKFVTDNDFFENYTIGNGGAISDFQTRSFVIEETTENNTVLSGNEATSETSKGGAIFVSGAQGPVRISGRLIDSEESDASILFVNNKAGSGGGIAIEEEVVAAEGERAAVQIQLHGILIKKNVALSDGGGAYFKDVAGEPLIEGVIFEANNKVVGNKTRGGGLFALRSDVKVEKSWFIGNKGARGAGAFVGQSKLEVSEVKFELNKGIVGAGLRLVGGSSANSYGTIEFNSNHATWGSGGMHVGGSTFVVKGFLSAISNTTDGKAGAIGLYGRSIFVVEKNAVANFERNIAIKGAGAIFGSTGSTQGDPKVIIRGGIFCKGNKPQNTAGSIQIVGCENDVQTYKD